MSEKLTRRTVTLDAEAERALKKVRSKHAIRKKPVNVSEAVRVSLINEAKP